MTVDRVFAFADRVTDARAESEPHEAHWETWVTFRIAGEVFGFAVSAIQEIVRVGEIVLAQNGSVTPIERLREKVTDAELARVGGETDTAMVFALILRRHEAGEPLFDAVSATVSELRREQKPVTGTLRRIRPRTAFATTALAPYAGAGPSCAEASLVGSRTLVMSRPCLS